MTTRRRFRSRGSTRGMRQRTTWEQTLNSFVMTGPAQRFIIDLSHVTIRDSENSGGTCKRLIGSVKAENAGSGDEHIVFSTGITVMTADAAVAALTPDPSSDFDQDWYFWQGQAFHLHQAGALASTDSMVEIAKIDIHTARRLRGGFRLVMIIEKGVTVEVAWNLTVGLRALWSLQA